MKTLTVTQSITQYLRTQIISGELKPGQKLIENNLASLLEASTAPIREAFLILEKEQLVEKIPRKGCFVTEVSREDCRQIFQVRLAIELCAIGILQEANIRNLPDVASALKASLSMLQTRLVDQKGPLRKHNPFPEFHIKLIESTRNRWLVNLYNTIYPTLARYQFIAYLANVPGKAQEEHKQILDLIERGKYGKAKECLRVHTSRIEKRLRKILSTDIH
jgi:DNA-binding GntR family transcriptional regulator